MLQPIIEYTMLQLQSIVIENTVITSEAENIPQMTFNALL